MKSIQMLDLKINFLFKRRANRVDAMIISKQITCAYVNVEKAKFLSPLKNSIENLLIAYNIQKIKNKFFLAQSFFSIVLRYIVAKRSTTIS